MFETLLHHIFIVFANWKDPHCFLDAFAGIHSLNVISRDVYFTSFPNTPLLQAYQSFSLIYEYKNSLADDLDRDPPPPPPSLHHTDYSLVHRECRMIMPLPLPPSWRFQSIISENPHREEDKPARKPICLFKKIPGERGWRVEGENIDFQRTDCLQWFLYNKQKNYGNTINILMLCHILRQHYRLQLQNMQ